jgi:hypothetical protein
MTHLKITVEMFLIGMTSEEHAMGKINEVLILITGSGGVGLP